MNQEEAKTILEMIELPISRNRLKKRFRELSMKCHPDMGGDAVKFILLKSAKKEEKRADRVRGMA